MDGQGEVIKSFLVGLGFDVDESSLSVFNKAIQTAALRVTGLYGAINAFAASMVYAFAKIADGFEEMGYQYHIIAPQINKAIVLRNEMIKAYSAAGINIRKVIVDSIKLNMSLAKTKFAMEAIYKSVASRFFGVLEKQSDAFRKKLYQNMPYIINVLEKFVKIIFKAFDVVTQLGMRVWSILARVYQFFKDLDEATGGWSTKILAVVAAWQFLNLAFLATPLGMLLTGLVSLLALYDDFKTYQEGGKSFFNWGPVIPIIEQLTSSLKAMFTILLDIARISSDIWNADWGDAIKNVLGIADAFTAIQHAIENVIKYLSGPAGVLTGLLNFRDKIDSGAADLFKGFDTSVFSRFGANGGALGSGGGVNNATTIHANMQTAVNVSGSPNAQATGSAVAAAQGSVNKDMVRNLKGSTR